MKKTLITLISALALSQAAFAQTYTTMTTLSAAVTVSDRQIRLASGTNVQAGGALFVDWEYMDVQSCANSACTIVNVNRTQKPAAHASAANVFVATQAMKPNVMLSHDGARRAGQCSTSTSSTPATALAAYQYLPIIDIDTGDVYNCRRNGLSGTWVWNRTNVQTFNGEAGSVPTAWP